jgi:hypothetical protein
VSGRSNRRGPEEEGEEAHLDILEGPAVEELDVAAGGRFHDGHRRRRVGWGGGGGWRRREWETLVDSAGRAGCEEVHFMGGLRIV